MLGAMGETTKKRVMVRYRVRPDAVGENERLVREVFAALERERPDGIRYATFKLDETAFMHLASVETADGSNPLFAIAAFQAFSKTIAERCVEPPVTTVLEEVGTYRVL